MPNPTYRDAAVAATGAALTLMQDPDATSIRLEGVRESLADALRITLVAYADETGSLPESDGQLLGALERYLDGWAG